MDASILETVLAAGLGALAGAAGGAAGANLALRTRVVAIEHELWGVKGENGLKSDVADAHKRIDRALERERHDVHRIDKRNRQQHPETLYSEDDA